MTLTLTQTLTLTLTKAIDRWPRKLLWEGAGFFQVAVTAPDYIVFLLLDL
jgi:hypothetical protein